MLQKELQKIGLSEKEAQVYLAMLHIGKSVVQDIAKQAKVNRVTTYNIIDSLVKKGLVSSFSQGKKTFFIPESPERLVRLIEFRELEIDEIENRFNDIFPELNSIFLNCENKPKIKFFEGKDGIKSIQEEYLKCKSKQIYNISNMDKLVAFPWDFVSDYRPRRVKKRIKLKAIYITDNEFLDKFKSSKSELMETIKISYKKINFESDITIFDDKVAISSFRKSNVFVLLIQNKEITQSFWVIFNYLWNNK